jgi:plastocyanin
MVIPQGGSLSFVNDDLPQHNVVATQSDPVTGQPLFQSRLIGLGEVAAVNGVERLGSGSYGFYCTIHPGMTGTLLVAP